VELVDKLAGRLIPSTQEFTDEHFEALLELNLPPKELALVNFYKKNHNKSCSMEELKRAGVSGVCVNSINRMCNAHGLWLGIKPEQGNPLQSKKYRFFVLEKKAETSYVDNYIGPHG
jgi:hypothetical protein